MQNLPGEVKTIIETLGLQSHPEGGWYRQVYCSGRVMPPEENDLPGRPMCTSIYFLITQTNFSAFHRLRNLELWYHHGGGKLEIIMIRPDGSKETRILGPVDKDCEPQVLVPAGCWFAACIHDDAEWALTGCNMAPGFIFEDFELGRRSELSKAYPQHKNVIEALTRH